MTRAIGLATCALLLSVGPAHSVFAAARSSPARADRAPRAQQTTSLADAQHLFDAGQYNQAIDVLTAAAARSPNDAQMAVLLGRCYYELGDFSRAIDGLEHGVELAPNDSNAHDWLGRAYGRKAEGDLLFGYTLARKTRHEFVTAVGLQPTNLEAQRDLIRFDLNAPAIVGGGDEKALREIDSLSQIDPVEGSLARAEYFAAKKQYADADDLYQKILAAPKSVGVCFEAADYYRDRGDGTKMSAAVSAAAKIDPNDPRLAYYRGVADVMSGQRAAEAEQLLRAYMNSTPEYSEMPSHASAHEWLGALFEKEGRNSEAAEEYKACLSADPKDRAAREGLRRLGRD